MPSFASLMKSGSSFPLTDMVVGLFCFNCAMHVYLHGRVVHHVDYVMPWGTREKKAEEHH